MALSIVVAKALMVVKSKVHHPAATFAASGA
jgi:hypothetical protein